MNWVLHTSSSSAPPGVNLGSSRGLTPTVLLIVVILTIVFFLSALLHFLVRFLVSVAGTSYRVDAAEGSVTALQGQLRRLFHLHDAGLDQSFIDNLPVFFYNAIVGSQGDPFDCAVCLCEFQPEDELRLIPKCSHGFHVECIDTWLLSHSTCPLCRASLQHDGHRLCSSPIVVVLESSSEASQELGPDTPSTRFEIPTIPGGFGRKDEGSREEKVVAVKLGKFRGSENVGGSSNGFDDVGTNIVNERRCFSMGSFGYIMDETSKLRVLIRTPVRKQRNKKPPLPLPLAPSHRLAMSMHNSESMREFSEFERANAEINVGNTKRMFVDRIEESNRGRRKESFSVSKTWLRDKKKRPVVDDSSSRRRAFSFRFPVTRSLEDEEEENDDHRSPGTLQGDNGEEADGSSFARRTLFWILGRHNAKVVHSSENV